MSDTSVASEVRDRVLSTRGRFWRPEDFDASPEAVSKALARLSKAGELRRVRRGLYWRGHSTPLGMAPPPAGRFLEKMIDAAGIGPAGWSAALALGVSTQVPRRETVAVPTRTPRNPGPVKIVSRAASTKRRDERLRPIEVAVLEVLRDWDELVEVPFPHAVSRIKDLIDGGAVRVERLVRASATEPPRVREGLRCLLTAVGRDETADGVRPARTALLREAVLAG